MAIKINQNNQFNQFVKFAQDAMEAGKAKAIARENIIENGGGAVRTITRGSGDHAFAFKRSRANKTANDTVRELFRDSVIAMFGSEDKIPESVKKAMLLKDYGVGKPLTARRILAVQKAITKAVEPIYGKVSRQVAEATVDHAVEYMNKNNPNVLKKKDKLFSVELSKEQRAEAAATVMRHGGGLTETGLKILANYVVSAVAMGYDADLVARQALKEISKFRDIPLGDSRFETINAQYKNYAQDVLEEHMSADMDKSFDSDSIFDSLAKDANRVQYTIGGESFDLGQEKDVMAKFKEKVTNPQHRRALSTFFNQMPGSHMIAMSLKNPMPESPKYKEFNPAEMKGGEMFTAFDSKGNFFMYGATLVVKNTRGTLDISEDGKTATMRLYNDGYIEFGIEASGDNSHAAVGSFTWKQEFVFDLSGDKPTIKSARIGQSLDA